MKILATTFLSFIFLFQSSGPVMDWCCELLKIPNLVEHYNEQTAGSGIGFIEFLDYHYGDQKNLNRHQDDGHDGELPLQGHHVCSHGFSFVNSDTFELAVIEPLEDQSISVFYQPPFSSAALGGIFQPPQV
ncbi:hypothetical protein LZ575_04435 [Antarcticibacterium sp. 1MA-6-2]|uniref:hypothetical protein n=1 Tax=Antarcticibacterium sp. 1MA-6-2 TaxID=2908210 RepID=UPI001F2EC291|nr:hypothetical protein [Antarcticibacterium sp. 1MA-6-2]UJH91900.1 hypothetical protein LZ575_04435 [Antarcticibacterium sp. 1MA-6-2]